MRTLTVAAALLALAGCHREGQDNVPGAAPDASRTASATPSAIATVRRSQVHHAVLDARGLSVGRNPATARRFTFGAPRAAVEKASGTWLGPAVRSANEECGAGPMEFTRYGGLTLAWQDDRLIGWFAEEDPAIVTSDGVRPGMLLRDLEVARSARFIEDSTLEGEFDYLAADGHEIGGFANGTERDARIESLYAGVNCFFR